MNIQYAVVGKLRWKDYPNDNTDWSNWSPDIFEDLTPGEASRIKEELIEAYKAKRYYASPKAKDPEKTYSVNIIAYVRKLSTCDISDVIE